MSDTNIRILSENDTKDGLILVSFNSALFDWPRNYYYDYNRYTFYTKRSCPDISGATECAEYLLNN
jgi:transglutaminase-like putative cysteine protease